MEIPLKRALLNTTTPVPSSTSPAAPPKKFLGPPGNPPPALLCAEPRVCWSFRNTSLGSCPISANSRDLRKGRVSLRKESRTLSVDCLLRESPVERQGHLEHHGARGLYYPMKTSCRAASNCFRMLESNLYSYASQHLQIVENTVKYKSSLAFAVTPEPYRNCKSD